MNKELKYWTAKQICDCPKYPFTIGMIRHFLTNREKNGLHKCVRKIGKNLYFRIDLFDDWVESHNEVFP